ncbi:transcription termination/antitermination protein NusA [Candidatus Dojkabacteria bacterium]|nr:transcription termination/antitermination protein NusA [Candidatus Dojkabacteria bacterium]
MAVQSELMTAINQISADRGIDADTVYQSITDAIKSAYEKEYGSDVEIDIDIDQREGILKAFLTKTVVKSVENNQTQVSKKEADTLTGQKVKIGDKIKVEVPVSDFGRIAARAAKNVLIGSIRTAERESIFDDIQTKIGNVVSAKIQRMRGETAIVEVDRAIAIMPPEEQIGNEFYKIGERYRVMIKGVEEVNNRKEVIVSRATNEFLAGLFEIEIPEIASGSVEIKSTAREVGFRSKVAVTSDQEGIDPIGSCIGQKGVRISNIMNELGTEKVDVIEWAENPERFIANALSPAKVIDVKINNKNEAIVNVDDDQVSLAIGREGQNVRLAAKLTGYKITVTAKSLKKKLTSESDVEELNKAAIEMREKIMAEETAKAEEEKKTKEEDKSKSEPVK